MTSASTQPIAMPATESTVRRAFRLTLLAA
jgi:hypothetical protein